MTERRRHERVKASIPIDWGLTPECLKHDRITSFSVAGCFIQTRESVAASTRIYMRFFLSNKGERIISGEVRYNLEQVGLGVQFLDLTARDREQFETLVSHYRARSGK
ncbi:MAG TPA: PilZ domain-containing protein [Pyrinomonadaceae bacterium]|nr:PilZ domain-containing protein [Pyrinomonadaceae bacterium]